MSGGALRDPLIFYLWHTVCESSSSLEAFMLEVVNVDGSRETLLNNRFVFEP